MGPIVSGEFIFHGTNLSISSVYRPEGGGMREGWHWISRKHFVIAWVNYIANTFKV